LDETKLSRTEEFMGIHPGDVVSFVGGGGKSMLIHSVARRLAKEGRTVLATATRPVSWQPGDSPSLFLCGEREFAELRPNLGEHGTVTIAPSRLEDGRLAPFRPEEIGGLAEAASYVFVEAEDSGGASLPLPPPEPRPVPPSTSVLCAVAGLDALGPDLDTAAFAERLLAPDGLIRCCPDAKWTVLMLNKADRQPARQDGALIARRVRDLMEPSWTRPKILLTSIQDFYKPL
jgi:hypothetical protein